MAHLAVPKELRFPAVVRVGSGSIAALADFARSTGETRIAVVTDKGIVDAGLAEKALAVLTGAGVTPLLFDGVKPDPSSASVEAVARQAAEAGVKAVVGIGGGSSLDTAKLVSLLLRSPQPLDPLQGVVGAKGERVPLALIPTTAGSGSEATAVAVVTSAEGRKLGILTRQLLPDMAILDPDLTLSLPPRPTAMAGLDAISHALEASASTVRGNDFSRRMGTVALSRLVPALDTVLTEGSNIEARNDMLYGSFLAGLAFAVTQTAAMHAFAYYLDEIPHGAAIALVMPHILRANAGADPSLYAALAQSALGPEASVNDLAARLEEMRARAGLPGTLAQAKISRNVPELAGLIAGQTYLLDNNPRAFIESEIADLLESIAG